MAFNLNDLTLHNITPLTTKLSELQLGYVHWFSMRQNAPTCFKLLWMAALTRLWWQYTWRRPVHSFLPTIYVLLMVCNLLIVTGYQGFLGIPIIIPFSSNIVKYWSMGRQLALYNFIVQTWWCYDCFSCRVCYDRAGMLLSCLPYASTRPGFVYFSVIFVWVLTSH